MPWNKNAPNGGFTVGKPWLPIPEEHLARAVDVEKSEPDSPFSLCREFTRWRRNVPALKTGEISFLPSSDGKLICSRAAADDCTILACFNLSDSVFDWTLPDDGWQPIPVRGFEGMVKGKKVSLKSYSAAFFARPGLTR